MKPFTSLEKISFDAHGATIERAMSAHAKACDAADLRRDGVVTKELNAFIDRVRAIPGADTPALTKAARSAIKADAHIVGLVEGGALSRARCDRVRNGGAGRSTGRSSRYNRSPGRD